MIRIVLLGRTGNNLFQYALGRVLAARHAVPLTLDASWHDSAGWSEVSHFLRLPLKARVVRRFSIPKRALRKLSGIHPWEFLQVPFLRESERDQSFDRRLAEAPPDCVLFGYFQSPLYFESLEQELRSEIRGLLSMDGGFVPSGNPSAGLNGASSVAVHVRRGDYLAHPALSVCGGSYYNEALNRAREAVPGARFFVFSDDPDWCRGFFRSDDTEVVDSENAGKNPLHDLRLMASASHHIIANSSYSWWAAWLARRPGQQVWLPARWYTDEGPVAPIAEKVLPGWIPVAVD
jgi:hypothetical protein